MPVGGVLQTGSSRTWPTSTKPATLATTAGGGAAARRRLRHLAALPGSGSPGVLASRTASSRASARHMARGAWAGAGASRRGCASDGGARGAAARASRAAGERGGAGAAETGGAEVAEARGRVAEVPSSGAQAPPAPPGMYSQALRSPPRPLGSRGCSLPLCVHRRRRPLGFPPWQDRRIPRANHPVLPRARAAAALPTARVVVAVGGGCTGRPGEVTRR